MIAITDFDDVVYVPITLPVKCMDNFMMYFQEGQVNCSSSVYYSSFVSVVIVEIGLVVLLCLWLILDFSGRILD